MASDRDVNQTFGNTSADNNSQVFAGHVDNVNKISLHMHVFAKGTALEGLDVPAGSEKSVAATRRRLKTILQLAFGRFGWLKGPQKWELLDQVLTSSGVELVSPASFDVEWYKELRDHHNDMHGVFFEGGGPKRIPLPTQSSMSSSPAHSSLRALTVCLSCFCSENGIVAVLERLIPCGLLQGNIHDEDIIFEGSLLTSLREWVASVLSEEASNKFRDYLLKTAKEALDKLQSKGPHPSSSWAMYYESIHSERWDQELQIILGVLKWAITPTHERPASIESRYPTRSLRAWTAASMLSQLGFRQISAGNRIVTRRDEYDEAFKANPFKDQSYDVFLVATHTGDLETDLLADPMVFAPDDAPPPRPMLLQNIPVLAFGHTRYMQLNPKISPPTLHEAFKHAFSTAVQSFERIQVTGRDQFMVKLVVNASKNPIPFANNIRDLFDIFSPHIHDICLEPFVAFVGSGNIVNGEDWAFSRNPESLFDKATDLVLTQKRWMANFFQVLAIVLGAMYGVCSRACRDQCTHLGLNSEIAFDPQSIYRDSGRKVTRWARHVGRALQGTLGYSEWASLLFEMFLGAEATDSPPDKNEKLVLGVQCNGFTAVSDILVRLKIRPEHLGEFHIVRGQLLNFPYDKDDGLIRASNFSSYPVEVRVDVVNERWDDEHDRNREQFPMDTTRFDIEPDWGPGKEADQQTVVLNMRRTGILAASINLRTVLSRLGRCVINCSCGGSIDAAALKEDLYSWQRLSLKDLEAFVRRGTPKRRLADVTKAHENFIIDASQCPEALVYVLGVLHANVIIVTQKCLACAIKHKPDAENAVVVIAGHHINERENSLVLGRRGVY
ncbi:hypothetical protein QBC40DRAFT_326871 [Triangularia verruculosa]|uniref:Uncharacterized protein n=1 Tax=Triangularia verruculosa TaxID=2587418 RepID=A0AAN7AVQ0_9PEZI|nr:hypothetical protein QBC40DRAFT_326871 [Triangularia verruculosa]